VIVNSAWLDELRQHPHLLTFVEISPWDDTTWICLIESSLLPEGYHGEQIAIRESTDPLTIRFKREMDT
jgi:hypothetical protein